MQPCKPQRQRLPKSEGPGMVAWMLLQICGQGPPRYCRLDSDEHALDGQRATGQRSSCLPVRQIALHVCESTVFGVETVVVPGMALELENQGRLRIIVHPAWADHVAVLAHAAIEHYPLDLGGRRMSCSQRRPMGNQAPE